MGRGAVGGTEAVEWVVVDVGECAGGSITMMAQHRRSVSTRAVSEALSVPLTTLCCTLYPIVSRAIAHRRPLPVVTMPPAMAENGTVRMRTSHPLAPFLAHILCEQWNEPRKRHVRCYRSYPDACWISSTAHCF